VTDQDAFVAVIGMAGRFPGAETVEALWANLCAGTESITRLPESTDQVVAGYGILEHADELDAEFFGYAPLEALILDPQQRLFLECAHQALERAGYGWADHRGSVGVFAGGSNTDYRAAVEAALDRLPFVDRWQVRLATAPDFLATRVAHKLGLTGPAVTVQTACSTSLVAVHLAGQALLAGDCQLALAGGAAVHVPYPRVGYTEGGIISPDGHCRAFDAAATGTVGGSAVAAVLLKPLPDALADGDHIHAVLRGSAVNNDGGGAIGFTAPSVDGQAAVVRAAQVVAGVDAGSIGYLEAHGTGTRLGDPIEVAALTRAFRATTDRCGYCAIGSVKSNLGHTDAAAGVTGLVKAVLAVEHGLIPPSLHVSRPNPEIDWAGSPFVVNTSLRRWRPDRPRRAGVSSLGVGGTNAHVVVEEPPPGPSPDPDRNPQLLVVSAKTPTGLAEAGRRLSSYLADHPDADLADVAWTLQVGRQPHRLRRFTVCATAAAGAAVLRGDPAAAGAPDPAGAGNAGAGPPPVGFMFPGQGGQHVGMARELYRHQPGFRAALSECAELAAPALGLDLREVLYPAPGDQSAHGWAAQRLATIAIGQPAVFAVEYALAQLLRDWGVVPEVVVGHSLGAYAAACVAGVMSLPDAIGLVVRRGQLLGSLPAGGMAGVGLPEPELRSLLPPELSVAAVNGPGRCAVAGPAGAVRRFAGQLRRREIEVRVLPIATAGHSALVEPVVDRLRAAVARVGLRDPEIRFVSDTTGEWAAPGQLTTGDYWATHLRAPVRFGRALATLLAEPGRVLVEVGPGRTLVTLARQHPATGTHRVVQALPHPQDEISDLACLLGAVGQLWSAGVPVDWPRLHPGRRRRRVLLPTYPFERKRYLVPAPGPAEGPRPPAGAGAREVILAAPVAGAPAAAGAGPAPGPEAPETAVRAAWRTAFAQALGFAEVSAHDDLFLLGGDSLTAGKLAGWARRQFAVPVRAADVIRMRTAAGCARLVEGPGLAGVGRGRAAREHGPPARGLSGWLARRRPVADPVCRLYCFPHSGGAAGEYLRWADALPEVEVWGVNLPGRGGRLAEPAHRSMTELARGVTEGITFDPPFVLFGHSFGTLLGYHVAQQLRAHGGAQPELLVLSGYPPPHLPRAVPPISTLPDAELLRRLDDHYGGVPRQLREDPDTAALVLPGLRADLAILEEYADPRLPPLDTPLVIVAGDRDPVGTDQLGQWDRHTTGGCRVQLLPGDHFYFRDRPDPLFQLLREAIRAPAARPS
jgi:acyl transferase domain-containing protein/surfactin synthase thioesterase subunit